MKPIRGSLLWGVGVAVMLMGIGLSSASAGIVERATWESGTSSAGSNFYGAHGIAVGSHGNLYVVDNLYHRIEKLSPHGRFLMTWGWGVKDGKEKFEMCRQHCRRGRYGSGNGQFNGPWGIGTDTRGHVYVADTGNNRIEKFSSQGRYLRQWGGKGSGSGRFHRPFDVAADSHGHVYVADFYGGRIKKFSPTGRFLDQWDASYPYSVITDPGGNVYVAEYYPDRIEKFSPGGRFLLSWGWGVKDGANRFQRCRPPQVYCQPGIFGDGSGQYKIPTDVATDSHGHVYTTDNGNEHIDKFTAGGRLLAEWKRHDPASITVGRSGRIYLLAPPGVVKYATGR